MSQKLIWIIVVIIVGTSVYFALNQQPSPSLSQITNFEECARAGYPVGESNPAQCWTPEGKHFVEEVSQVPFPISGPITISGEIACLSKIGGGAQTMECATGLKGTDDRYYTLKNLFKLDPEYKFSSSGLRVEVSGTFSREEVKSPDGNRYDVVGVIDVTSIKEIRTNPTPPLSKSCFKTGCSSQICADSEVITTCEYRSEYECYQTTRCERQASGACGWTQSPELISCLAKPNQN